MPLRPQVGGGGLEALLAKYAGMSSQQDLPYDPLLAEEQQVARRYSATAQVGEDQARRQVEENRQRALKLIEDLEKAGVTRGSEYEKASQIALYGESKGGNWFTRALSWLDKPGMLVRYLLADITQQDEGLDSEITAGDYWDIIMGRTESLKQRLGTDLVGEDGRMSGSQLLHLWGYEETGGFWPGLLRGVASVGTEILTDPLTLLTGGASASTKAVRLSTTTRVVRTASMGARAAVKAGRGAIDDIADPFVRRLANKIDDVARVEADRLTREAVETVGPKFVLDRPSVLREIDDAAIDLAEKKVRAQVIDEVTPQLLGRNFGHRAVRELAEYSGTPGILKGGVRVNLTPWGAVKGGGMVIPGTQGLGRRITNRVLGKSGAIKGQEATWIRGALGKMFPRASGAVAEFSTRQDYQTYLRGIMAGKVSASAVDHAREFIPQAIENLGINRALERMRVTMNDMQATLERAGFKDEGVADILERVAAPIIEGGIIDEDEIMAVVRAAFNEVGHAADPELVTDVARFVSTYRKTIDRAADMARQVGVLPEQPLDRYFPHVMTPEARNILAELAERGVAPEGVTWQQQLVQEILSGTQQRKIAGGVIGESRFAQERVIGQTVEEIKDGVVAIDVARFRQDVPEAYLDEFDEFMEAFGTVHAGTGAVHLSVETMNKELGPVVQALVEATEGVALPRGTTTLKLFDDNPLTVAHAYLGSLNDAIIERLTVREFEKVGLISPAIREINQQRTAYRMARTLSSKSPTAIQKMARSVQKMIDDFDESIAVHRGRGAMETVRVGGSKVMFPVEAMSRRVRAKAKRLLKAVDNAVEFEKRTVDLRDEVSRELKKKGVPADLADAVATATTLDEALQVSRAARDELSDTFIAETVSLRQALEEQAVGDEGALAVLRAQDEHVARLTQEMAEARRELDKAWRKKRTQKVPIQVPLVGSDGVIAQQVNERLIASVLSHDGLTPDLERIAQALLDTIYVTDAVSAERLRLALYDFYEMVNERLVELKAQPLTLRKASGEPMHIPARGSTGRMTPAEVAAYESSPEVRALLYAVDAFGAAVDLASLQVGIDAFALSPSGRQRFQRVMERNLGIDNMEWRYDDQHRMFPVLMEGKARLIGPTRAEVQEWLRKRGLTFAEGKELAQTESFNMPVERYTTMVTLDSDVGGTFSREAAGMTVSANRGMVILPSGEFETVYDHVIHAVAVRQGLIPAEVRPAGAHADAARQLIARGLLPADANTGLIARGQDGGIWFDGFKGHGRIPEVGSDAPWDEVAPAAKARLIDFCEKNGVTEFEARHGQRSVRRRVVVAEERKALSDLLDGMDEPMRKALVDAPPEEIALADRYLELLDERDLLKAGGTMARGQVRGSKLRVWRKGASGTLPPGVAPRFASQMRQAGDVIVHGRPVRHTLDIFPATRASATPQQIQKGLKPIDEWEILVWDRSGAGAGAYINDSGEWQIVGAFNVSEQRGAGSDALARAVREAHLSDPERKIILYSFDENDFLPSRYRGLGFAERERYAWDDSIWDADYPNDPWIGEAKPDFVKMEWIGPDAKAVRQSINEHDAARGLLKSVQGKARQGQWSEVTRLLSDPNARRTLAAVGLDEAYDQYATMAAARNLLSNKNLPDQVREIVEANQNLIRQASSRQSALRSLEDMGAVLSEIAGKTKHTAVKQQIIMARRLMTILGDLGVGIGKGPDGQLMSTVLAADPDTYLRQIKEARKLARELGWEQAADALSLKPVASVRAQPGEVLIKNFALSGEAIDYKSANPYIGLFLENMVRNLQALHTPPGLRFLATQTRAVANWWKGMATVARPTFHPRNLIGGIWNNQIAGVRARDYIWVRDKMIYLRRAMSSGNKTFDDALDAGLRAGKFTPDDIQVLRDMRTYGVMDASFSRAEGLRVGRRVKKSINPASMDGPLVRAGALTMESIEDFLRASAFRRWHKEMGPQVAADWSIAVHFDYRNLTAMEQKVKTVVPFFVWTRRNLPLQLSALVERPDLIARYQHLMHGMDDQWDYSPYDEMPGNPWTSSLQIGTGVVFGADTPFWARAIISPDLPLTDLEAIENPLSIGSWLNFATSTLGPHITTPFQMQAQEDFGMVNAPAGLAQIMWALDRLGLYENVSEAGTPRMPRDLRMLAETALPIHGEYLRQFDTDPARASRLGISADSGMFSSDRVRGAALRLAGGFGVRTDTPHDAYSGAYQVSDELSEMIKELRLRGILPNEDAA